MGVCPCGAQVWTTLGINWKPDSSANTMWAPIRAAFFLSGASLFVSSAQWLLHPAPGPAAPVSADSSPSHASSDRHGRDDIEPQIHAGSAPQCGPWSTGWCDSHRPGLHARANEPSASVGGAPALTGDLESSVTS